MEFLCDGDANESRDVALPDAPACTCAVCRTASADVDLSSTGNGEIVLFVRNETTGNVYARGLNINLDNVFTQAQIVATPYNNLNPTLITLNGLRPDSDGREKRHRHPLLHALHVPTL